MKYIVFLVLLLIPIQISDSSIYYCIDFPNTSSNNYTETIDENIQEYLKFKNTLAFLESSHRYDAVSKSGTYLGKYQFGPRALEDIGIQVDREEFLNNHILQEEALYAYLLKNKQYLSKEIEEFSGTYINGYYITEAGLLASAHLVGARSVKRFLRSNCSIVAADGNGTPLTKYLELFQYEFELDESIKAYISHGKI